MLRDMFGRPATSLQVFDEASKQIVKYLREVQPMASWSVTRLEGEDQVYLAIVDDVYGKTAGDRIPWTQSFCQFMATGEAPGIAPDAMAVPQYREITVSTGQKIGAYLGATIRLDDGCLFGTLCGFDPNPILDNKVDENLLDLLADMLGKLLSVDPSTKHWRREQRRIMASFRT